MYQFKQLKAKYLFVSEVIKPSGENCIYSKVEVLTALPNLVEGLNFFLEGSFGERINGNALTDFNDVMLKLGQSLYPIELNVLKTGKIKRVKNFEEIQGQWSKECKNILATHKNAHWVERYINMTSKNIRSEESFLRMLRQNSFTQLFFMEEGAIKQHVRLCAFPFADTVIDVEFDVKSSYENEYHYKAEIEKVDEKIGSSHGELEVRYTGKGQPESILFQYRAEVISEGFYTKRITIKLTTNK